MLGQGFSKVKRIFVPQLLVSRWFSRFVAQIIVGKRLGVYTTALYNRIMTCNYNNTTTNSLQRNIYAKRTQRTKFDIIPYPSFLLAMSIQKGHMRGDAPPQRRSASGPISTSHPASSGPPFQPHPLHAPRSVHPSSTCQHGASEWAPAAPQDMESSKVRTP